MQRRQFLRGVLTTGAVVLTASAGTAVVSGTAAAKLPGAAGSTRTAGTEVESWLLATGRRALAS